MKIKGSYLYFTLLACACVAACAYAVANMFADPPLLVFLALLLVFFCIGLWLKDALIGVRYLFYCVCVQLLFAAAIFAIHKFPAMAQFVRSAEIGVGGAGIPLGIALLVLPAFFCALPYYYRTGVKKILQKLILGGILILNVAITLAYAFYFERLFYGAI